MATSLQLHDIVHDFWRALDVRDYDMLTALIAEDGVWQREVMIQGRAAIRKALDARPDGLVTRHLVSNLRISNEDGHPVARHLLTTLGTMVVHADAGPPPDCGSPALVADIEMHFSSGADAPLLTEIRTQIIFLKPH